MSIKVHKEHFEILKSLQFKLSHQLHVCLFSAYVSYMRQVLDETMRLSVLVSWDGRCQQVDAELDGYFIPKNVSFI